MAPILPGATIGILGGGQLGRMTAMAARTMGYAVHVLDPDPECPAAAVADRCVTAPFDDVDAASDLARHCDVVTIEIEQISVGALEAAQCHAPVRPTPAMVAMIQDRSAQKAWLRAAGMPLGEYHDVIDAASLTSAAGALGPLFVKANRGGYDGRSQLRVARPEDAPRAWTALGGRPCVAERAIDLEAELSVMVARSPSGEVRVYAPALNHHEGQVLAWSVMPAPVPAAVTAQAIDIATEIATMCALEGLVAVELFLDRRGQLLVNELAPRPHNSFHETERACAVSQFEQLVRAVCDLPLGDTTVLTPAAIVNLFGDLWLDSAGPRFAGPLQRPGIRLHLYGKRTARRGRKMGHLSAIGDSPEEALRSVHEAARLLAIAE
jgi:5-(carboxyamino)imidazole ribonucleotide synthase